MLGWLLKRFGLRPSVSIESSGASSLHVGNVDTVIVFQITQPAPCMECDQQRQSNDCKCPET